MQAAKTMRSVIGAAGLAQNRVLRNTVLMFANNLLSAAGGLVFWFLAARTQAPAIVGVATAGTTMMILLSGISQIGLGVGCIRFYGALGPRRAARLLAMFGLVAALAVLVAAVFGWFAAWLAPGLAPMFAAPRDWAWFVAACVGWTLSVQFENYLVGRRLAGVLVFKSGLLAAMRIVLIGTLAQPSVAVIIAITGVSGLASGLVALPFALRRPAEPSRAEPPVTNRAILVYSLWNYLAGLAGTLPSLVIPSIAVSMRGGSEAAAYYMAWTLFSALQFVPSALAWVLFAEHAAGADAAQPLHYQRRTGVLMWLLCGAFVPAALGVLWLMGPTYLAFGWPALLLLVAGFWPYYRVQVLTATLRVRATQWPLTLAHTAVHLLIVAASIPLLSWVGTPGAALAWSCGQAGLALWLGWLARSEGANTQ